MPQHRPAPSRPLPAAAAPASGTRCSRRLVLALSLALLGLIAAAFLPVLRNGFINFDDNEYVTENTQVQKGLSWENLGVAFRSIAAANWHPLTLLSHMADCQLFGLRPWGHHLTNLLYHAANTVLLFLLLRKMTGAIWRSFFVAAFFGVHPLHVESVAWVSERKDVLSTFFFLLTIWAYVCFVERRPAPPEAAARAGAPSPMQSLPPPSHRSLPAGFWYVLSLFLFALGLLSKPMLVTLPFVLLLLDYWPLRRTAEGEVTAAQTSPSQAPEPPIADASWPWSRLVVEKAPFFVLAILFSAITFVVQNRVGAVWTVERLPLLGRLENALVAYGRYVGKLFWPSHLAIFYPHPGEWPVAVCLLTLLLLAAGTFLALKLRRSAPYLLVGWFWYLGILVPVIGLVQVGWQSMADRYMYIPLIGLAVALVWGAEAALRPRRSGLVIARVLAAALVLVCAALTRVQVGYWADSETLFRHTLRVTDNSWVARHNLAMALLNQGRLDEAITEFRNAIALRPKAPDSYNGVGEALLRQGHLDEALELFHKAIELKPNFAVARNNLGIIFTKKGMIDQAVTEFQAALQARPGYAKAHNNLGMALQAQGRLDDAITQLELAVHFAPDDPEARNNLGMALGRKGRLDEAIVQLEAALKLNPKDAQARHNLGLAFSRQGRLPEAQAQLLRALELKPDSPETHATLAAVLARLGRREEAIRHLTEALRLRPNYPQAEQQLRALTGQGH